MKQFILVVSIILAYLVTGNAQEKRASHIGNGLYLIASMDTVSINKDLLTASQKALKFSPLFEEFNGAENTTIVVDTKEYVPLELEKAPATEQQTEQKKKLLLTLTPKASEKLKAFTAKHVMQRVAIVVDGEVLTVHKIKEAITSGQLQITRCNDNACERLLVSLKGNVKKQKH